MNPNDNNLNINQNNNQAVSSSQPIQNNEPVSSIAPKEEIPMSVEIVEETKKEENLFSQDLNNTSKEPVSSITPDASTPADSQVQSRDSLYNFQTNAINPNANVNVNDFRIDETTKTTSLPEISNLEGTVETKNANPEINSNQPSPVTEKTINEPVIDISSNSDTKINIENTTQVENTPVPSPSGNNTALIIVLGVIFAAGLIAGAYFVFFKKPTSVEKSTVSNEKYQTEKIIVKPSNETKVLTEEEYITKIKSYIERYNNNIRNLKMKQVTPNLTLDQKLEIYMNYSTELLNIYTDLQNLKVPQNYRDAHDKLTLSLYALNTLFDTLVLETKNRDITPAKEQQIQQIFISIQKAETVAASAFNEIAGVQK